MTKKTIVNELTKTQEALAVAQARVEELEGFLTGTQALPITQLPLDFYRHTLDHLMESCQIIGFDWRYLYMNEAAAVSGRMPKEQLIGRTVMEMYPGIEATPMFALMKACMEERSVGESEFEFVYADQSRAWFDFRIQPVPEGIFILTLNITERKLADKHVQKLNRTLSVLSDINQAIVRVRDIPTLFKQACDIAVEKGTFKMAWIGLLDPKTRHIVPMGHAGLPDSIIEKLYIPVDDKIWGSGPTGIAVRSKQHVIINDVAGDPNLKHWRTDALSLGYKASATLPLVVEGEVRGIFHLMSEDADFFDDAEIRLIDEMANDVAFALEFADRETLRKQADENLKRTAKRLEVLHIIDKELIRGRSISDLVQMTLKHIRDIIPCQQASLILIDHKTNEGVVYAIDYKQAAIFREGTRYPLPPDTFKGYDARHVKVYDDLRQQPESDERSQQLADEGLASSLTVFLMGQDAPIAALSLLSDQKAFFTEEYQEIAAEISDQLSVAIRQLRLSEELEQRVQERTVELNEAKSRVEAILNSSPDGVVFAYISEGIQQTNETFNTLFTCTADDFFGQSLTVLVAEADRVTLTEAIKSVVATHEGQSVEVRARDKKGHLFEAEMSIRAMPTLRAKEGGFVCSIRDITERKRLAKELNDQRSFLREVIDVSPSMIFVKDFDGHFVLANPMVAQMYNTTTEKLIGKADADFNPSSQEVVDFLDADRRVIETGETFIIEEPVTNLNQETRWFQTIKVPIVSADGKSKYVLGVSTDISERRKSEAVLHEAFKKERELGELKSRIVSMASHEFRTPLATIMAVTETLTAYRKKLSDEQIDQRLYKIQDQIGHLRDVIDDILQLAQIQAKRVVFNPVRVDLDAMCRSVLDEFQSRPNIKHELVYKCDTELQDAILDKRLMRQIISNLMSNAVKYSPDGKIIRINLEEKDDNLIFRISDQGIGIPEADLKHLFEPFHRAQNVGAISGTGLGLAITKESIELHGGTIDVESKVGIGTTFVVTIPHVMDTKPAVEEVPKTEG